MKVSLVTISYNQARFLEEAIRSVLQQNYPALEYIVVDAGSSDDSRAIIEKYRSQISKIIFEPDRGPADGLNKGFSHASGKIFGYLNADDLLLPGAIAAITRVFQKKPALDVLSGHGWVVDENSRPLYREFSWPYSLTFYRYQCTTILQQATFFRAEKFWQSAGFNLANKTCWDSELMVDLALRGARFGLTNQFLACFRLHKDSISGSARLKTEYEQNVQRILQRLPATSKIPGARAFICLRNRLANPYALFWRTLDEIQHPGAHKTLRMPQ
ncbi:MAG: glycosyltransferase family 2 protein [Anaerolineales bacterium]